MLILCLYSKITFSAINVDRTRAFVNGKEGKTLINIQNVSKHKPYLVHAWLETIDGNKKGVPLDAIPSLQRIEPGKKGVIQIKANENIRSFPENKESAFYITIREIPPVVDSTNLLHLALQTRIKVFYRPDSLLNFKGKHWEESLTLKRLSKGYEIINPSSFNATIIDLFDERLGRKNSQFKPVMLLPGSSVRFDTTHFKKPVLQIVTDHGGQPTLKFNCSYSSCERERSD